MRKNNNQKYSIYKILLIVGYVMLTACEKDDFVGSAGENENNNTEEVNLDIEAVYLAQTHVFEPNYKVPNTDKEFKLVSEREVLIKAHLISSEEVSSPEVKAIVESNGSSNTIILSGPSNLPQSFNKNIGEVVHSFDDSFTGVIPKEWVKPNMKLSIVSGNKKKEYNTLKIGAPNRIYMTNFEINAFEIQSTDFSNGWEEEFALKVPSAEMRVQNIPNILFKEISVPPHYSGPAGASVKAARVSSLGDYISKIGSEFTAHNTTATQWNVALLTAAGRYYNRVKYFSTSWSYTDRHQKGVAGGFRGVQRRGHLGVFLHEFGHGLSLPHWAAVDNYPYKGDMHGIKAPDTYRGTHSGPIWMYDSVQRRFIPPTQNDVTPLTYKNDPMQGGGDKFKESGYLTNHFSDYSVNQARDYMENLLVVYKNGEYYLWDDATGDYTLRINNDGNVSFPTQRNQQVVSVMTSISNATPEANIAYPPVGPYTSGMIPLFDPRVEADRNAADNFCGDRGCDFTLKITQGGIVKYIMLGMNFDDTLPETDPKTFVTKAVNLLASDGEVTKVEVLKTPDANINGLPNMETILTSWEKE